jgi:hypothetical protein
MSMQLFIMVAMSVPPSVPPQRDPSLQIVRDMQCYSYGYCTSTWYSEEIVGGLRAQTLRRGLFRSNRALTVFDLT